MLATGWSEVSPQTALAQLDKILNSSQFRSSKRCSVFLRHVVEHAAENNVESLKERSLGVEVFGRDPHYDTNQDPVVRSTAGEVRKRLAQYYLEEGHRDEIRISLPPGSYNPEIHPSPERTVVPVAPAQVAVLPRRRWRWILAAGIAVAASAAAILFVPLFHPTNLDRFWAPIVDASVPAVVVVGQPKAFKLEPSMQREVETWIEETAEGENPPAPHSIPFADLKSMWDRNVSLVDVQAMQPLCQLLTRKGKKTEIRGARVSSLADLRGKPCVLIGAFNNDWTMRLTSDLRFYFGPGPTHESMVIVDRQNQNRKDWAGSRNWPAPINLASDYAIVSRTYNPTIEQTIVTVAGASGYGTYAASEFLANEGYFTAALKDAPRDWYRKNMQVVLSVKVISGTPGPPRVQATHFW